jgi:hypothetical protein
MKNPIPAQICQVKTMARSVRITFDTQETLTANQKAELFDMNEKLGYLFFFDKPEATINTADLPAIPLEDGEKSPSQRLRAVLFIWWQQNGKKDDFELFYRRWMRRTIEQVKQQLM